MDSTPDKNDKTVQGFIKKLHNNIFDKNEFNKCSEIIKKECNEHHNEYLESLRNSKHFKIHEEDFLEGTQKEPWYYPKEWQGTYPDQGMKIHIGLRPRALKIFFKLMEEMVDEHCGKIRCFEFKTASLQGKGFYHTIFQDISQESQENLEGYLKSLTAQIGKSVVFYPQKDEKSFEVIPEKYRSIIEKINKEILFFSQRNFDNFLTTCYLAFLINKVIANAVKEGGLKREDFIPSVGDFKIGEYVYARFGILNGGITSIDNAGFLPSTLSPEEATSPDDRTFPLPHIMFTEEGFSALAHYKEMCEYIKVSKGLNFYLHPETSRRKLQETSDEPFVSTESSESLDNPESSHNTPSHTKKIKKDKKPEKKKIPEKDKEWISFDEFFKKYQESKI